MCLTVSNWVQYSEKKNGKVQLLLQIVTVYLRLHVLFENLSCGHSYAIQKFKPPSLGTRGTWHARAPIFNRPLSRTTCRLACYLIATEPPFPMSPPNNFFTDCVGKSTEDHKLEDLQ